MNIMFDWASFRVPCYHPSPIEGGRVLKVKPDGGIEWEIAARLPVVGSHDSNLMIRTCGVDEREGVGRCGVKLEVSGNPSKWLQGHNLFGGFVGLPALLEMTMYRLCEVISELQPDDFDRQFWRQGIFELTRVDVNTMIGLRTRERARSYMQAAEQTGYMRHRGRGSLVKNGTVYWGLGSKRSVSKLYVKADELEAGKGHGLHDELLNREQLLAWADDKLRFEVMVRSNELRKRGLHLAANWRDDTASRLLLSTAESLVMSNQELFPDIVLSQLPPNLRMAYESWQNGADLREILSRPTFYRYRKQLLPLGVDIGVKRPSKPVSNVVPLRQVLDAYPATIPEWAYGTPLLVGPADLEAARARFQDRRRAA